MAQNLSKVLAEAPALLALPKVPFTQGSFSSPLSLQTHPPTKIPIPRKRLHGKYSDKTHRMLELKGTSERMWSSGFPVPVCRLLLDWLQKNNMGSDFKLQKPKLPLWEFRLSSLGWITRFFF